MDQIDVNLFKAWNRISEKVRRDRIEAARRFARRKSLLRPVRPWCLCIRASDTRITQMNTVITPHPDVPLSVDGDVDDLLQTGIPHKLTLTGSTIRELCKPVEIPWPGIDWTRAAAQLGRHPESLRSWIRNGVLNSMYVNAMSQSKRGKPVPIVWSASPLDPNSNTGRPPDPIWGTLWQTFWAKLPEEYVLEVERVPKMRSYRGKKRQRGWHFICPGRMGIDGEYIGCGRNVLRLFGPQSVWTIANQNGMENGFEMSEDSGLVGQWFPGLHDPIAQSGPRSFACHHCWKLRYGSLVSRNGWNEFVMYLSGGLLYGSEVKRPLIEAPGIASGDTCLIRAPRRGEVKF